MLSLSISLRTGLAIFSAVVAILILVSIVLYYINPTTKGPGMTPDGSKGGELTLFFANWCPACKSIKPEWDQFRNDYSNKTINGVILLIQEVDCSQPNPETEDLMNQYNIVGFPTVKLTCNGKITELQQKPTYDNLVKFVNSPL
jgi:thiol-disulfide isomerase/thioredoxin